MGKRKKQSELDAILEQLKKSYGADVDSDLEDSLLNTEDTERDDELSSVLERIFMDSDLEAYDKTDIESEEQSEESAEPSDEAAKESAYVEKVIDTKEDPVEEAAEVTADDYEQIGIDFADDSERSEEESVEGIKSEHIDATVIAEITETIAPESGSSVVEESRSTEEQQVEDILSKMLSIDSEKDNMKPSTFKAISAVISGVSDEALDDTDDYDEISELSVIEEDDHEDIEINDYEEIDDVLSDVEDEYSEDIYIDEISVDEDMDLYDYDAEEVPLPHIVLTADEYTYDPLQQDLDEMKFYKPHLDIDYEEPTVPEYEAVAKSDKNVGTTLDNNDISLLLKFGYDDEVKTQVGDEKAQKVRFEKDTSFAPDANKRPHGFCGKELSDRSQIKKIRNKYKSDRKSLIVSSIAVVAIAFLSIISTVLFNISDDKTNVYPLFLLIEFVAVAAVSMILGKKLISGVISISKFEADLYTVLAFIIGEYLLYNVVTSIIYAANPALFDSIPVTLFGICVFIYASFVVVCDLADCCRESNTFDIMALNDYVYTAEKQSSFDRNMPNHRKKLVSGQNDHGKYKIVKTGIVSGYFKKISSARSANINLVYILGIVPIFSMLVGCCAAIIGENIIYGIYAMMMSSLLCIPYSYIFLTPLVDYIISRRLKKKDIGFIGYAAPADYSSVDTLIFDDNDAVELVSYTEINPNKSNADSKKWVDIACEVFRALGGPLSKICEDKVGTRVSENRELIINSISDNGIDIYFDSSMNILMGDRQYMLSRNLKVKTDTNLTTATKGAERSVLYVAFDGQPQIAFIITSKIKPSFMDMVAYLSARNIRTFVRSYEPHINDMFFEQNKAAISTLKTTVYEDNRCRKICDGAIISSDCIKLAESISQSECVASGRKKMKKINFSVIVAGIVMAILMALSMSINAQWQFIDAIKPHIPVVFYILMTLQLIPAAIYMLRECIKNDNQQGF